MIALIAEVNIEYAVESYCIENYAVKAAAVMDYEDKIVVAVLTKPIFTRSERQGLFRALSDDLGRRFGKKAIVTSDLEVYSKIIMYNKGRDIDPADVVNIAERRAM